MVWPLFPPATSLVLFPCFLHCSNMSYFSVSQMSPNFFPLKRVDMFFPLPESHSSQPWLFNPISAFSSQFKQHFPKKVFQNCLSNSCDIVFREVHFSFVPLITVYVNLCKYLINNYLPYWTTSPMRAGTNVFLLTQTPHARIIA